MQNHKSRTKHAAPFFCIARHNLFRVSQYAAALIVVPHGRNSTNKQNSLPVPEHGAYDFSDRHHLFGGGLL